LKVAMINDCASVGETLLKFMPKEVNSVHLCRDRGLWNKTLGLAWKIHKLNADLYHVNYLLQDCFLARHLNKKPLIGHAHGSDLREMIHSKRYGWIVRGNLKHCDKVLVAQPTILEVAKQFNESAEYLPIPFNPLLFYPKPIPENTPKKIFIASTHNFRIKGTDKFLLALKNVPNVEIKSLAAGPDYQSAVKMASDLNINFIPKVPHEKINEFYWESDLVLGSCGIGQLDTVAIEAMACGRPVIHHLKEGYYSNVPLPRCTGSIEMLKNAITTFLNDTQVVNALINSQLEYVNATHEASKVAAHLFEIYKQLA
jgi:glycosyltransferase involved in cell wall biosynthesis